MLPFRYSLYILTLSLLLACSSEKSNEEKEPASSKDLFPRATLFIITEDLAIPFWQQPGYNSPWSNVYRLYYWGAVKENAKAIAMGFETDEFDSVSVAPIEYQATAFLLDKHYREDGGERPDYQKKREGYYYPFRIRDGATIKGIFANRQIKLVDIKKQELTLSNGFISPVEYHDLTKSFENISNIEIDVSYWKKVKEFGKVIYKLAKTERKRIFNFNSEDVRYMCFDHTAFDELVTSLSKKMKVDSKLPFVIQLID